ncbi:MAG: hypothetical protein Q9182_003645 [Xanthomendoza sp. 2 TL-2023]
MTRLFFLAAFFAGVLATYDYGGGNSMPADKSAGYMKDGTAEQKNSPADMKMDNKMPAEKYGGDMMNGGMNHTTDVKSGEVKSNTATVDVSITVISSYKGGNAPVEQISQPSMNQGAMHKVTVGGDAGLVFSPNTLTAMPGDMVEFTFMSMNHTLTQSTFDKPCKKMDGGADSGFLANPNNTISPPPTYMFQVKDTKPVCMTFSINPTPEKSQTMFMAKAIEQNGTAPAVSPMEKMSSSSSSSSSTSSMPPATTSTTPVANPAPTTTTTESTTMAPPAPSPASPQNMPPAPATPQNLNAAGAAQPGTNIVAGTGSMQAGGQCSCSCLCGTAAFPAGAGVGMYGGWSGAVPMM